MRASPVTPAPTATAAERRALLGRLRDDARGCVRCPQLAAARTTVVFGAGNPDADVLLVGESPGRGEDRQGLPLLGAAGRLMTDLLGEAGLRREDVYVTTVLKCRPPSNRDPLAEELANCRAYLHGQIELVRPKVVCTVGSFATKLLREDPAGIRGVRGRPEVRTIGTRTVRLLPLLHPDAALYEGALVELLRADLALLPELVARPAPPQPGPARVDRGPGEDDGSAVSAGAPGDPSPATSVEDDAPGGQLGLFGP
ncbi:uracil-DNA glycosylase [Patulibacter sp.]|uniref:uracil-DNA glycosylase n=1 Tax=Patulibacter sp. TaxID=1912859 RepID=UPI0027220AD8|nr:uracil-DNA glycosylase [Patulibacter sp.]MDO9410055.1 uracil-DNA glycosylase [Patulibacter sp.]